MAWEEWVVSDLTVDCPNMVQRQAISARSGTGTCHIQFAFNGFICH